MGAFILVIAVEVLAVFLILKQRDRFAVTGREGAAIAAYAAIALLQGITQKQVQFDDLIFTPFFLAIPIWLGVSGGINQGVVGTALSFFVLCGVSALLPANEANLDVGEGISFVHMTLGSMVLMFMGGAAGVLRERPAICGLLVLLWVLFIASMQPDLLLGIGTWLSIALGATLATAGLVLRTRGLVDRSLAWLRATSVKER
jgi:hypothetical protein